MAESYTSSYFPSQVVSDGEKLSMDYGLKVGKAIESEWFKRDSGTNRFASNQNNFHKLRLYARGEQSIQKYKDELSINGDLSYLNLDWKPVPIIAKFVDIVVNGLSNKDYEIKAFAQDPVALKKRTDYATAILQDMAAKPYLDNLQNTLGLNEYQTDKTKLPESEEELDLHMQLSYKQSIEIAEEEAISSVMDHNKYDLTKRRLNMDLTVCGIAACKTNFNTAEGITVDYVDPAYMVYSYTEDPNFEDIYYVGEIKSITIPELKKEFPDISNEELEFITNNAPASNKAETLAFSKWRGNLPLWAIAVAHFCNNYSLFVFLSWLPIFIKDGLGVPMAAVGLLAMLPHIASFIFLNIGGYFADYLTNKGVKLITVRKLCNTIAFGGSGICLCIVPELNSVAGVIAIMCLGNVFGGFSAGGFIVNHADIGPRHTGRLMGITNMFAAIPGFVGAIITGMILDATNSWDMVFYVVAGITFFGGIFYLLFASTEKQFD